MKRCEQLVRFKAESNSGPCDAGLMQTRMTPIYRFTYQLHPDQSSKGTHLGRSPLQ